MDSVIPLGQKNTLAEYMILFGVDNRPPMLDKDLVAKDLWERVQLLIYRREFNKGVLEGVFYVAWWCIWFFTNQLLFAAKKPRKDVLFDEIVLRSFNWCSARRLPKIQETEPLFKMARLQCNKYMGDKPKRQRNAAWYKEKEMLAEAKDDGQIFDEEQLAFLADPGVPDGQVVQTIIINNVAFQTEDLDTYDSDYDDISNAQAVLMANISNYGFDVISEENVQDTHLQAQQDSIILYVIEQMSKQIINHVNNWKKANKDQNNESVTAELERYKERVKTFEQRLNIDLNSHEKMIDSQMDDIIKEKLAQKEQVDSLEQNLSKQNKESECLLQTFTDFKHESKEKEDKNIENKIDLEKKIKKLDNIIFKVGQSAHTVHIFFEKNDLKAQLEDKDTTICKLNNITKSLREKSKDENVNYDYGEIETKNIELENSVAKFSSENERLCNEINHVKQNVQARFRKALLQNMKAHIDYLKYTKEQADILRRIVKQAKVKQPLDNALDFAYCSLVSGLQIFKTHDKEPLSAHELCKLDSKADIGIFVGYAPAKKAFRIYNKRTYKIIETIHVTFDELTAMAYGQFSSGLGLHYLTPATSSSGFVSNTVSQQPCIPPNRDDWDHLFQPMFDEYFTPPSIAVSPVQEAAVSRAVVLAESSVSTSIDQDTPSTSTPSTQEQEQSQNISQGFEESPKTLIFRDDPLNKSPHEVSTSQGSSLNMRQTHTPFESLSRWTKDHLIANVINDRSRSVSTRKQLQTDAMWCYFDGFLTSIVPKNFKQEMTEPSWIEAMQEEIHEFERLQVWKLVPCPNKVFLIKLKWIYKVKTDEFSGVLKNKTRLVAQGL
uniref:Retroviral polymerase SH3-like domain-containing protein n=1 Tax=Tanacetum cinerariifolium TaxID=118510 RepID=A0A699GNM9_TANCI|nr:hypothetical protein [Tanacetum cinerariifolium]